MADDPQETEPETVPQELSTAEKKAAEKHASRTFTAPEGTEIATTVRDGERIEITFPFTTSDEDVIEVLAGLASDPDHPVQEG